MKTTLEKLEEYLKNINQEEFDQEFDQIKDVGINGPTIEEVKAELNNNKYKNNINYIDYSGLN